MKINEQHSKEERQSLRVQVPELDLNACELEELGQQERIEKIMKTMKTNLISKVLDVSEYSTKFHIGRFFRIFIYHLIYWYFGPLLTVPLVIVFDSMALKTIIINDD